MPRPKTSGSRLKPPPQPPTAVGTMPPDGRAPSKTRRAISFLGAHHGVGRSTVAFYAAVAWADWAASRVVCIPSDFATAEKFRQRLGIAENEGGRESEIEFSSCGVGVLALARDPVQFASLNRAAVVQYLADLNRTFDLFLDIDPSSLFHEALLRESDHGFWVMSSSHAANDEDIKAMMRLRESEPTPGKIDLIFNRAGGPGRIDERALDRSLEALGTTQIFAIPELRDVDDWSLEHASLNPNFTAAFRPLLIKIEGEDAVPDARRGRLKPYVGPNLRHEVDLLRAILNDADSEQSSDIHLEKRSGRNAIRFRIGEALMQRPPLSDQDFESLVTRIKIVSKMDLTERSRPQEGSFSIKIAGRRSIFLVSAIGTESGERIVLRRDSK